MVLHQDGMFKVKEGLTTMKEFLSPVSYAMKAYKIDHTILVPKKSAQASTNSSQRTREA